MSKFIENSDLKNLIVSIILMHDDPEQFYFDMSDKEDPIANIIKFIDACDFNGSTVSKVTIDETTKGTYNNIEQIVEDVNIDADKIDVVDDETFDKIVMHMDFTESEQNDVFALYTDGDFVYFVDRYGDGGVRLIELA